MLICTPYIVKNGKVIYPKNAKQFCFEVTEEQHKAYLERKKQKEQVKKAKKAKKDNTPTEEKDE